MANNVQCNEEMNCVTCPVKGPLCTMLTNDELSIINHKRYDIFFKKGETIKKQGTYMSHVISIRSGQCKMYLEGINKKNIILRIIQPHSFIGGPGMYVDHRHHYTVSAIQDTSACFIEIENFKKVMDMNKAFHDSVITEICNNSLITYNRLINITQKQMYGRIADVLLYLTDEVYKSRSFKLTMSNQDIAELAGMSRDSVVRVIRSFASEGYIKADHHNVEIIDYEALNRLNLIG